MYQGHHNDGSSIQRHSVGATYPYVLLMRNDRVSMLHPDGSESAARHLGTTRAERLAAIQATLDEGEMLAGDKRNLDAERARRAYFGMSLQDIQEAVLAGQAVHWSNDGYRVIRDDIGQWLIHCAWNGACWGLTHQDGATLNGEPRQFYIEGDR